MLGSPAKRRRTSPSTFVPVANEDVNRTTNSNPSTPRRASYLSPTKASLARSHPKILSQSRRNRQLDSNKASLRDEVLGQSKQAAIAADVSRTEPAPRTDTHVPSNGTRTATFNFADAITNAFNAPGENDRNTRRSPLRVRQPSVGRAQTNENERSLSTAIVPKLVSNGTRKSRAISERRSTDPDLPPTPVQLGLDQPPERPRGLASSSSPGGSGRRRIRVRSGQITSSPLKPKDRAPIYPDTAPADVEIASGIGDEAESEPETRTEQNVDDDHLIANTSHLRAKQESLRMLKGELDEMKKELAKFKALSHVVEVNVGENASELDQVIHMLQVSSSFETQVSPDLKVSPLVSTENLNSYLKLFAPGNLRLSHMTWTKHVKQRAKLIHQLTIAPPTPWPLDVLAFTFDAVVDVTEARIEKVTNLNSELDSRMFGGSGALQQWMMNRLAHPLYDKDLGTLIWGAGKYFDECVKRAKIFKALSDLFSKSVNMPQIEGDNPSQDRMGQLQRIDTLIRDKDEIFPLLPFLGTAQIVFLGQLPEPNHAQKKIMLLYNIDLTWTGRTTIRVEIIASGMSGKARRAAEELFEKAMKTQDVLRAFQAVWDLLEMDPQSYEMPVTRTKGKRKRTRAS